MGVTVPFDVTLSLCAFTDVSVEVVKEWLVDFEIGGPSFSSVRRAVLKQLNCDLLIFKQETPVLVRLVYWNGCVQFPFYRLLV